MKEITTIIVDDEKLSREMLKKLVETHIPDMEILGEASSAESAVELIREHNPEVVFLDISMPGKSGFDVVKEIQDFKDIPKIIFVTAYDKYAINAVKCAAFDYLLKPVNTEELLDCYNRYMKVRSANSVHKSVDALLKHLKRDKLSFTTRTGCFFIDPRTIIYIQADGNYSHIHLTDGTEKTVTVNIGEILTMLGENNFSRISRSTISNLKCLSELNKSDKTCILKVEEEEVPLHYHPSFIHDLIAP